VFQYLLALIAKILSLHCKIISWSKKLISVKYTLFCHSGHYRQQQKFVSPLIKATCIDNYKILRWVDEKNLTSNYSFWTYHREHWKCRYGMVNTFISLKIILVDRLVV